MTKLFASMAVLAAALAVTGCGSKSKSASPGTTVANAPPAAQSPDQWAKRVVDWFLRPLNPDLLVVGNFSNAQVGFYIQTGNQQTIDTINARMTDLQRCGNHLARVGPPPGDDQTLKEIDRHFHTSCTAYVKVGATLLRATKLLSSGNKDQVAKGQDALRGLGSSTRVGAVELTAGIKLAERRPEFRRAGLKPSV